MSDNTAGRALQAMDKIEHNVGRATEVMAAASKAMGINLAGGLDSMVAAFDVARAAIEHSRVMVERHPELSDPANAEIPTFKALLVAVAKLAEYAPNDAPNSGNDAQ